MTTQPAEASAYDRFSSTSSECTGSSSEPPSFSGTQILNNPSRCSASTAAGDSSPSVSAYSASASSSGTSALAFSARMDSPVSDSPSGMLLTPFAVAVGELKQARRFLAASSLSVVSLRRPTMNRPA